MECMKWSGQKTKSKLDYLKEMEENHGKRERRKTE